MKTENQNSDVLAFRGSKKAPMTFDELIVKTVPHITVERPRSIQKQVDTQELYLEVEGEKPIVQLEKVEGEKEIGGTWKINISSLDSKIITKARLGKFAIRKSPMEYVKEIDESVGFGGFKPDWVQATHIPQLMPKSARQYMKRINGRSVSPLYVFGNDDRSTFRDATYPWGLVGKIFAGSGSETLWTGSGALVGKNTVITAGHVAPWNKSNWWMKFVPAYYNDTSLHGSSVESYVESFNGYDTQGDVTGYDWAVLKLYEPLGEQLGYFGYNSYDEEWNDKNYWSIVGYPGAIASGLRPAYQTNVSIFDVDSDSNGGQELETKADLTPGNSGGPMFGWWNGEPRIIGVVSGQEEDYIFPASTESGNVIASGAGFTNLISWARSNWQ